MKRKDKKRKPPITPGVLPTPDSILTIKETAAALRVTDRTIINWLEDDTIPSSAVLRGKQTVRLIWSEVRLGMTNRVPKQEIP